VVLLKEELRQAHAGHQLEVCNPTPYTLLPTPYTLNPTPCSLHPAPSTLHPTPYTLNPTHSTHHPTPYCQVEKLGGEIRHLRGWAGKLREQRDEAEVRERGTE